MNHVVALGGVVAVLATGGLSPIRIAQSDQALAVIVAADHARSARPQDIALIYRRKKLFWNDGTKVIPVNLPASDPLRGLFSRVILGASPEELEKYWNTMYFHGVSPPFVLSSEEAVLRFVIQTPGATGYISYCHADSRVKVVLIVTAAGPISEDFARTACPK